MERTWKKCRSLPVSTALFSRTIPASIGLGGKCTGYRCKFAKHWGNDLSIARIARARTSGCRDSAKDEPNAWRSNRRALMGERLINGLDLFDRQAANAVLRTRIRERRWRSLISMRRRPMARRRPMIMVSRRRQRTAAPHVVTMDPDAPTFLPGASVGHRGNGGARCGGQQDDREKSSHTCSTKIQTEP